MGDYAVSVVSILALSALSAMLSYRSDDKFVKLAASVIVLYVCLVPLSGLSADNFDFEEIFDIGSEEIDKGDYQTVAEDAFSLGIKRLISSRFDIPETDIAVALTDFDTDKMKAGKIKITLYRKGATVDIKILEEYIEEAEIGACEAEYGTW